MKTVLILGGTAEAIHLAEELQKHSNLRVITSLAGRTKSPDAIAGEVRSGGFGGVMGLVEYLAKENIRLMIDATHPFARQISVNARLAAKLSGVALKRVSRPPWQPRPGESWVSVCSIEEAANALPFDARAFLALGSQHLEAFRHRDDVHFIARMVDQPTALPELNSLEIVTGRPGAEIADELALFRRFKPSHLVCRNSGGSRGIAKLDAARELEIAIIMIERPIMP